MLRSPPLVPLLGPPPTFPSVEEMLPVACVTSVTTPATPSRSLATLSTYIKSASGFHSVPTLLDSGAEPDAVAPEALVRAWFPEVALKPAGFVAGALGHPVPSLITEVAVPIFFRSGLSIRIRIKTMPISKYQLILGEGVLRQHGVCLDYSSNTVTMRDPGDSSRSLFIKGNLLAQEHVDAHVAAVFAPSPAEQASVASESPSPEAVLDDFEIAHSPDTATIYFVRPVFQEGETEFEVTDSAHGPATLERLADPTRWSAKERNQFLASQLHDSVCALTSVLQDTTAPPARKKAAKSQLTAAFPALKEDLRGRFDEATAFKVASLLSEFSHDVFGEYDTVPLPPHRGDLDFPIPLKPGAVPKFSNPYRHSEPIRAEINRQCKSMLQAGTLKVSTSPWAAPVIAVAKPDGSLRICQDFRKLNGETIPFRYPIPLPDDLFDKVRGSTVFSKIDLFSGYGNLRIRAEDQHRAAFITQDNCYQPEVLLFGLTSAPCWFQKVMSTILREHVEAGYLTIYLDDLCIHSRTREEHFQHLRAVLNTLRQHQFLARVKKCEFLKTEIHYLGFILSGAGVRVDPAKTEAIRNRAPPSNVKELRSLLGATNFYRAFIRNFSEIAAPLTDLLRGASRGSKIPWLQIHQDAYDLLITALTEPPCLRTFDPALPTRLAVDASEECRAVGGVLMQKSTEGWQPVAYYSHKLDAAEIRYPVRDKELLAIKKALERWRHYLLGISFAVQTDHQSLSYLYSSKHLSGRSQRWLDFFAEFGGLRDIVYVRGEKNVVADWISRPPGSAPSASCPQVFNLRVIGSDFLDQLRADLPHAIGAIRSIVARLQDPAYSVA